MSAFAQNRTLWIVLAVIVIVGGWMAMGYNSLVSSRESVNTAWAQVETNYQRRFDLVPNLVSTVKGAADFEQETLESVTAARTQWMGSTDRSSRVEAAQGFDSALSRLLVTVEAYPQLQATQAFRDLMAQLEGTENRISVSRMDYNNEVMAYNTKVKRFPGNILAGLFGFGAETPFDAVPGSEVAPTVDFDDPQ